MPAGQAPYAAGQAPGAPGKATALLARLLPLLARRCLPVKPLPLLVRRCLRARPRRSWKAMPAGQAPAAPGKGTPGVSGQTPGSSVQDDPEHDRGTRNHRPSRSALHPLRRSAPARSCSRRSTSCSAGSGRQENLISLRFRSLPRIRVHPGPPRPGFFVATLFTLNEKTLRE